MSQVARKIVMVRPASFGFNPETAHSNFFQQEKQTDVNAQIEAVQEFDGFVAKLSAQEIEVLVIEDSAQPQKPDALFPNNWFCFLPNQTLVLFPMHAENRRLERNPKTIEWLVKTFSPLSVLDLTEWEKAGKFLEGTGSMVLDHQNKIAYACLSPRTHSEIFHLFCKKMEYKELAFHALDEKDRHIYHTNVMLSIGEKFAVVCLDCIPHSGEREKFRASLQQSGRAIIEITLDQVNHFAGNLLQVVNKNGIPFIILSDQALNCLTNEQKGKLSTYGEILAVSIPLIEKLGGGSARCMMAEIFSA